MIEKYNDNNILLVDTCDIIIDSENLGNSEKLIKIIINKYQQFRKDDVKCFLHKCSENGKYFASIDETGEIWKDDSIAFDNYLLSSNIKIF